jgi:hypothetical protein
LLNLMCPFFEAQIEVWKFDYYADEILGSILQPSTPSGRLSPPSHI